MVVNFDVLDGFQHVLVHVFFFPDLLNGLNQLFKEGKDLDVPGEHHDQKQEQGKAIAGCDNPIPAIRCPVEGQQGFCLADLLGDLCPVFPK